MLSGTKPTKLQKHLLIICIFVSCLLENIIWSTCIYSSSLCDEVFRDQEKPRETEESFSYPRIKAPSDRERVALEPEQTFQPHLVTVHMRHQSPFDNI